MVNNLSILARFTFVMPYIKILLFVCIFGVLSACSIFSHEGYNTQKNIPTKLISLLPVPAELQQQVWLEKFKFSFDNMPTALSHSTDKNMLLQTELKAKGINLAAMSFDGIPLAQASWLSETQSVNSELAVAKDFDAKQVLHDLQLVHWPIERIAFALFEGFSVDEQVLIEDHSTQKVKIRRFYHQGEEIIIIRYQVENITFKQLNAGYSLSITRLKTSEL